MRLWRPRCIRKHLSLRNFLITIALTCAAFLVAVSKLSRGPRPATEPNMAFRKVYQDSFGNVHHVQGKMMKLSSDEGHTEPQQKRSHNKNHRTSIIPKQNLGAKARSNRATKSVGKTAKPSASYGLWDKDVRTVNLSRVFAETNKARLQGVKSCGEGWQERYAVLHEEILKSVRPRRFLVYSCRGEGYGCAGYGNRIGGISSLFILAVLTKRAFLIDWNHPGRVALEHFLWPKRIKWNYSLANVKDLTSRTHYWGKGLPKKLQNSHIEKPSNYYPDFAQWFRDVDFEQYFDKPVETVTATWNFAQEIWSNPYLSRLAEDNGISVPPLKYMLIGCSYDFLFQRSPELENTLLEVKRNYTDSTAPVIGLHIRMGDAAFGRKRRLNIQDFKSFFSCARAVEDSMIKSNPNLNASHIKWFLATDYKRVKHYAEKEFPGKVITLNTEPEHIGIFQKQRFPTYEGTMAVFLDHFLLAECFFLILSNSTFGTTALGLRYHSTNSFTFGEKCGIVKRKIKQTPKR